MNLFKKRRKSIKLVAFGKLGYGVQLANGSYVSSVPNSSYTWSIDIYIEQFCVFPTEEAAIDAFNKTTAILTPTVIKETYV